MKINWIRVICFIILIIVVILIVIFALIIESSNKQRGCKIGNDCKCKDICDKSGFNLYVYSEDIFSNSCYCIKDGVSMRVG